MTTTTHLEISGPFDLREIALMGFGHRDERAPGAKPSNHAAHPHVATVRRQFELSGSPTVCVPSPSSVLQIEALPGQPADRIPRLHAAAEAAQQGQLDAERLRDHASRGCPGPAAATAWHWALLQLIDRDQGLRPCRCALAGRASVEGGDPICVRN